MQIHKCLKNVTNKEFKKVGSCEKLKTKSKK